MRKFITVSILCMCGLSMFSQAQTYMVKANRCFADINGDKKDDYIVLTGKASQPTVNVHYSNNLTFNTIPDIISTPTLFDDLVGDSYFADVNGDGRADYVTFQGDNRTPRIVAYLSTKDGFSKNNVITSAPFDRGYDDYPRGFADINADGRWDYITFRGQKKRPYIVAYLSTGKGFNPKSYKSESLLEPSADGITKAFADINADMRADFMDSYGNGEYINTYLSDLIDFNNHFIYLNKNMLSNGINKGYDDMPRGFYDLDGDKRADYVVFRGNEDKPNAYIHSSMGSYFEKTPVITRRLERGLEGMPNGFADVNGDGKWDYIAFRGNYNMPRPVVYFNIGNDFIEPCDLMNIVVKNDGAYNVYVKIRYQLENKVKYITSPVVITGDKFEAELPEDAYNVEVTTYCNECYDKRRVFTDLINRSDNPHKICYRVYGTQFKKYWDYNGCAN